MKLKTFLNYIKYSGLWMGVAINPYHWELRFVTDGHTDLDPKQHLVFVALGPFWIRGVIDDGTW
jgi:hypothetical protein